MPSSLFKPVTANTTTQELVSILSNYASAGKSINDVARDYGVSTQEAINNLNKAGISTSQLEAMGLLSTSQTSATQQTTPKANSQPSSLFKPVTANTTTQELVSILSNYASAGKSINDVARDYGVSTQEAINNLNKAGISTSQLEAMGLLSTSGGGMLGNAVPVQPQTTQTTPQYTPQSNFYGSPYKPVTNSTSKNELYDILQAYSSRGMNMDDIARDYGVSREEAISNLVKAGITRDELKMLGLLAPTITQIPTDKPIQLTEDMTEEQVRRMLRTYATAGKSFADVAAMYGVDPNTAMINLAKVGIAPSMLTVYFNDIDLGRNNAAAVAEATKIANQVRANYSLPSYVVQKHLQLEALKENAKSINDVLAATGTSNLNDAVNVLADYGIDPDFLYYRGLISRDELVRQAPDVFKAALRAHTTQSDMRGALYGRRYVLPPGDNTLAGEAGRIIGTANGTYSGYLIDAVDGGIYVPRYGYVNPTGYPGGARPSKSIR